MVALVLCGLVNLAAAAPMPLDATIREWDLPTPASLPHDPAIAPDGALWYAAQKANRLGRLDVRTGHVDEFPLPTPDSGPHGLVADRDGNIWYTANYAGLIGKLEPGTRRVTEYRMPDRAAEDPHTPVFDQKGILWFTVQRGNRIGRLDPATGKVDLREVPTPGARPYGLAVNHRGVPFFCEFGTNKLASVDPRSLEIREYVLPEGARPRRLAVAEDDTVYYADYGRGYLGRLDPTTGKIQEWSSPGGPASRPYGIAITPDGGVWYSESGVEPNTLVRFDPRRQTFALARIPSGGGVVRNMVATPDGRLFLACSGVNKVAVVAH